MSEYYKSETLAQSQGQKAIVSIPAWAQALHEGELGQKDKIDSAQAAYAYVPLIFRATRLVCNALVSVPVHFYKGKTEVDWMFPDVSLYWLLWRSQASMSLIGANYIEKIPRVRSKRIGGLEWINPTTMTAYTTRNDDKTYSYLFRQGTNGATWTQDDMIYMREFSLQGFKQTAGKDIQVLPGDSSASVSLNDAALLRYMSRWASRFFEGGAMPVTLVSIDGLMDKDETTRVEGFFKKAMTGIRNAWRVLAVSRQIEAKVISQPVKDLVIPELANQARRAVADAFDFHPSLLDEAPNMATAQEHRLSLYQDSVMPRGKMLQEEFNRQLFNPMGYRMEFAFEEMDVFQEDENDKSQTVVNITTAVNTDPEAAELAMNIMGYDLSDKQKRQLAALIADRKKKQEQSPTTTTPPTNTPAAETVAEQPPAKAAWMDDLGRWERKALRVLKESGSAVCEYVSDVLPAEIRAKVAARLAECETAEEVKALFDMQPVTATVTPVTEYKSSPDTLALAESINRLAEAYIKSIQATQESEQTNKESEK
jgi:HK97 family phage portal protein